MIIYTKLGQNRRFEAIELGQNFDYPVRIRLFRGLEAKRLPAFERFLLSFLRPDLSYKHNIKIC